METMQIQPYVMGRGAAAQAIEKSLRILQVIEPDREILPSRQLERGAALPSAAEPGVARVAIVATPHALHTAAILAAEAAGFDFVFAEKPVAVSLEQIEQLRNVRIPVAVFHGYRVAWGPEALRAQIAAGVLGEVFAIEGRYWQSSIAALVAAQAVAAPARASTGPAKKWKDDPALSGPADVLLDLAPHWVDLAAFLIGEAPAAIAGRQFFAGSPSPHRDTHVHLELEFSRGARGQASISKAVHGAGNDLEIHIMGTRARGSWRFQDPDRIVLGIGSELHVVSRTDTSLGSRQWAFHGLGWLEGYVEILRRGLTRLCGGSSAPYPDLASSLAVLEPLLAATRSEP
jgi:predicted dehydrogenase